MQTSLLMSKKCRGCCMVSMKPAKMYRMMGAHHASKSSILLKCRRQVSSAGCKEGSEGGTGQIRQPWQGAAGGLTHDAEACVCHVMCVRNGQARQLQLCEAKSA